MRAAPENAQDAASALSPEAQATIAALRAELAAVRAERDALREELRQRHEIGQRFLAALSRRQREADDREDDPAPERTLQ